MGEDAPSITTNENVTPETVELVEGYIEYQLRHPNTHSGQAMEKALHALIEAGVTNAACGTLDTFNTPMFRALITDRSALNIVARMVWWGESQENATIKDGISRGEVF